MTNNSSKELPPIRWSIRWKLMIIMTILIISLVAVLSYIQISMQKRMLEVELNNRIVLMKENLVERGRSFIRNLSQQLENHIASFNFSGAMELINDSVRENEEIKYAILMDSSGVAYINTYRPDLAQSKLTGIRDVKALEQKDIAAINYEEEGESIIEMVSPIQVSTKKWGVLRLIYTLKHLNSEIEISRKEIQHDIRRMIYRSVVISAGFMGICFVLVYILASRFSKPLINLTNSAKKISKGDFSVSSDVHIRSMDEVGLLAETFNQMSKN